MNKKKRKINGLDILIDNLVQQFSQIKDFDLLQSDNIGNTLFNMISFRLADISSYRDLVVHHFIPATNKAIFESKQMVRYSKYKDYLSVKDSDYNESVYQTIRLAYVGLFHKMESFLNDVLSMTDVINEDTKFDENVEKYAKREFGFQFRDWQQFSTTSKINWICNCVKHYDGFPKKGPRPISCYWFPDNIRLQLTTNEFQQDTDFFLKFCPMYLSLVFVLNNFRTFQSDFDYAFWKEHNPEQILAQEDAVAKMREIIVEMLSRFKEL